MLKALAHLSGVGTRVIQASKAGTITSLNSLAPVLTELARAGSDFPRSLQIVLTYPFMDAIVGKNPQQARDLHMGDYTNLSIDLQLSLKDLLGGGGGVGDKLLPCDQIPNPQVGQLCKQGNKIIQLTQDIIDHLPVPNPGGGGGIPGLPLPGGGGKKGGGKKGGGGGILGGGGPLGLGRAPVGSQVSGSTGAADSDAGGRAAGVDTGLAAMLLWGTMPR
jgi:phospholipid/cholesterol/gamma-HCH transport system substrate-binding protein